MRDAASLWGGLAVSGTRKRVSRGFILVLVLLAVTLVPAAMAQRAAETGVFTLTVANWNRTLNSVERYVEAGRSDPQRTVEFRESVAEIRTSALGVTEEAARALEALEPRLTALGPTPEDPALAETEEIAAERQRLVTQITDFRARQSLADLTLTRVASAQAALDELDREVFVAEITTRFPLPFEPTVIRDGVGQLLVAASTVAQTAPDWWQALPEDRKNATTLSAAAAVLLLAIFIAWAVRRVLLGRFGINQGEDAPSYTRRLVAALAEGLARGIVPSAFLLVILIRANTEGALINGAFAEVLAALCIALIAFILAVEIPRAALSPENPAWRLTRLTPNSAQSLVYQLRVLAFTFAAFEFFYGAASAVAADQLTAEATSVLETVGAVVLGFQILVLLRRAHWRFDPLSSEDEAEAESEVSEPTVPPTARRHYWQAIRWALILTTAVAMVVPFAGYALLADYLIGNLLSTGLLVGLMYLVRGFLREVIGLLTSSMAFRETLNWDHAFRSRLKFWLRALVDILLLPALVMAVLPVWGFPIETLFRWIGAVLEGVEVGGVRLSPADTILGVFVFFVILAVFRTLKIALGTRVLPQTRIDPGLQHSLTTGLGYIGFLAAAMIGIVVMGVDLSGIAIIAGALSVGIGFGLQNVVNNFVSGLILLVERPVKVGDWVVVGAIEGTVKQINVRSTEIETFQRASVIIPNADLIANSVTNWTHKDKYGRIDVPIGVAYGSDTQKVTQILLEIAKAHPRVMRFPEPFVVFQGFGASSLDFELRAYTNDVLWKVIIASDIRYSIDARFREDGIEIPFPQRVVHIARPPSDTSSKDDAPQ